MAIFEMKRKRARLAPICLYRWSVCLNGRFCQLEALLHENQGGGDARSQPAAGLQGDRTREQGIIMLRMQTCRPAMSGKACVLPLYIPDYLPCLKQTVDDAVISNLPPSPEPGSRRRGTANTRFVGEFTNSGGFLPSLIARISGLHLNHDIQRENADLESEVRASLLVHFAGEIASYEPWKLSLSRLTG
jgi:hypothetical protein